MFTGRNEAYRGGAPSFNSKRGGPQQNKRPFQVREDAYNRNPNSSSRYSISPVRNTHQNQNPITLYADAVDGHVPPRGRHDSYTRNGWHRRSNSPPSQRQSRSPLYVGSRSRSRSPERFIRGRAVSPRRRSKSPLYTNHGNGRRFSGSKSRSPVRSWRQPYAMSPIRDSNNRSPMPVNFPSHDAYSYDRRSRSRSASNMEMSSNEEGSPFRNTFRPIEPKKTKKIKIQVPKVLTREDDDDSSDEVVEIDYNGHKIRNAPEINLADKRRSRWDANQHVHSVPSTKDILKQQGVPNPDEALRNIASLPTLDDRFKAQPSDEDAIKMQLELLNAQSKLDEIRKNVPSSVGLPGSLAFSAIGKAPVNPTASPAKPVVTAAPIVPPSTIPSVNIPPIGNFPPPGFPMPGLQMPPVSMPLSFAIPPPGFVQPAGAGMVPPMGMPPFGAPPPRLSMPNPQMQQMQHVQQPAMDQTEIIFRARADNYRRDLNEIYSIPDLMKYMWGQGFDAIPPEDPPLLFNEVLKTREGALGASTLYQIICYGHPELETYYCAMCNHWTTCSEMFSHLTAPMHRMNFLSRNYKLFHQRAEGYTDLVERDKFLDLICKRVWKIDGSGSCVNRMRCILNIDAIKQVWPNYFEYVDNSWKMLGSNDGISGILERPQISQLDEQPVSPNIQNQNEIHYPGSSLNKGKIQIKPSVNTVLSRGPIGEMERVDDRRESKERRRSRSRSHERSKKKSRSRRSRSNSRRRENRRRSRSRSHSRSPSPRRQNKDKKRDWDQKTAEFLNRIENEGISATLNSMSAASVNQVRDEIEANRAHLRRKENSDAEQERARLTRKALAVLVELQQLHDEKGSIKKSMIFAVAAEMGMTEEEVQNSKILKQGLETMQIVNDSTTEQQKQLSLEALGLDSSNLTKLLNSVSSKNDDVSMAYPEVDTDSKLASSIRTAIAETENKLRDPKNMHLSAELRQRLNHLQIKLSQELGVDPVKRVVPNPMVRPRPMMPVPAAKAPLPGAWRSMAARDAGAALRIRRENEERPAQREEHRFEASKVEAEWYQYYLKDPSKINELTDVVNKKEEAQYDNFYGPGTYVAFCAAKKRAAANAKKALATNRLQNKPYFEDFTS